MKRFWVSWWHSWDYGEFEIHTPWWFAGFREGEESVCAAVIAESEEAAKRFVCAAYDRKDITPEFRFCEERVDDWSPFSGRFKQADWMKWPTMV